MRCGRGPPRSARTRPDCSITQRWARRIVQAFPALDGLHYNSRFAGGPCLVLFPRASDAMPSRPALSLPLTHPGLALRIASASQRLGYLVV
ncbi:RES domain-containing protein [Mycobacterium heidelbergense]|nr:RES domain-containing protein [Mycobacterium heidelbergense]